MSDSIDQLIYVDRDCESNAPFREALGQFAPVFATSDVSEGLARIEKVENSLGLLDTTTLQEASDTQINKLLDLRTMRAIGLVTGEDLPEYIYHLRLWGLTKTFVKQPPIDPFELKVFLDMVQEPSFGFGLISHLESTVQMFSLEIDCMKAKSIGIDRVIKHFTDHGFTSDNLYDVRLILEELINNALFHAFRTASGEEKYWIQDFDKLGKEESVRVEYGSDRRYVGFSVSDSAGQLPIGVLLGKLERQFSPDGLFDESGRGIYLTRMMASRFIVNLDRNRRTQMISLFSYDRSRSTNVKPFLLNYVGDDDFDSWRSEPEID